MSSDSMQTWSAADRAHSAHRSAEGICIFEAGDCRTGDCRLCSRPIEYAIIAMTDALKTELSALTVTVRK